MDARFAGSERLGERRRRRLAVEADESALREGAIEPMELAAARGARRIMHPAGGDMGVPGPSTAVPLPVERLIPAEWWKYLGGGIGIALVASGVVAAGWWAPACSEATGVSFGRVFSTGDSRAVDWT
jgi:hypothetical protein